MAKMFDPPHPGGILKEELDCLKVSVFDFAKQIDVDPAYLKSVLDEQALISAEMANRIALAITGPDSSTWLSMQADYEASVDREMPC